MASDMGSSPSDWYHETTGTLEPPSSPQKQTEKIKFCTNCGKLKNESHNFCGYCGAKLK
jgi:uncharacterized paraquat-inducible protein A